MEKRQEETLLRQNVWKTVRVFFRLFSPFCLRIFSLNCYFFCRAGTKTSKKTQKEEDKRAQDLGSSKNKTQSVEGVNLFTANMNCSSMIAKFFSSFKFVVLW